ncbi:hypothetical protein [Streptococcus parasuis]
MISKQETKTYVNNTIKLMKKEYGFNSKSGILFKMVEQYFLSINISVSGFDTPKISVKAYIKPSIIDDLFWDVFNMEDNKSQPPSLKAVGAFKFDPLRFYDSSIYIEEGDQVLPYIDSEIKIIIDIANDIASKCKTLEEFYSYSKNVLNSGFYDINLMYMLTKIHNSEYSAARRIAEEKIVSHEKGRFAQGNKYIYDYVVEYCLEKEKE